MNTQRQNAGAARRAGPSPQRAGVRLCAARGACWSLALVLGGCAMGELDLGSRGGDALGGGHDAAFDATGAGDARDALARSDGPGFDTALDAPAGDGDGADAPLATPDGADALALLDTPGDGRDGGGGDAAVGDAADAADAPDICSEITLPCDVSMPVPSPCRTGLGMECWGLARAYAPRGLCLYDIDVGSDICNSDGTCWGTGRRCLLAYNLCLTPRASICVCSAYPLACGPPS